MVIELKIGDKAPDFSLPDQDGKMHKLSGYKGKKVILYFYPKDMTPGCTAEACSFRDNVVVFKEKDAVILGISSDGRESHKKFSSKYNLPFAILSDADKEVSIKYGVYGEQKFIGIKYKGIARTTFLIDEKGKITKIYEKVNVGKHANELLNDLSEKKIMH